MQNQMRGLLKSINTYMDEKANHTYRTDNDDEIRNFADSEFGIDTGEMGVE